MQAPQFRYCDCPECGLLVRTTLVPDSPELRSVNALQWVAACPHCKSRVSITWLPPEKAVQLASPADVPPLPGSA